MTGDNECYTASGHAPPDIAEGDTLPNETRSLPSVLIFLAALAFLLLTVPANHTEAEDAYFYARMAESGRGAELFHRHHLLYLPLGRAFWLSARGLGLVERALPALIGLSAIAGAATIALLWRLFPRGGRIAALGLLFSYGFWRYSTTAEIYAPVVAFSVASFFCAARAERGEGWTWGAIGFGGVALLTHLTAIPAVLGAVPMLYAARGHRRQAIIHVAVTAALAAAAYGLVFSGPGAVAYTDATVVRPAGWSPRAWIGGGIAAGQTVLSGNFIFSFESLATRLESLFSSQMLHEEVFMGRQAPSAVRWTAPLTFATALAAMSGLWAGALQRAVRQRFKPSSTGREVFFGGIVWLLGGAALALVFEATNPEMWIPVLPALWICVACFSAPPSAEDRGPAPRLPVFALAGLLAHNAVGGFALIWRAEGDYGRQKTEWIANNSGPGDWILTADSHSVVTFLQYRSEAFVLDGRFVGLSDWRRFLEARPPKRVWILGEFFDPPRALRNRPLLAEQRRKELADFLAPDIVRVRQDNQITVFKWVAPSPATDELAP